MIAGTAALRVHSSGHHAGPSLRHIVRDASSGRIFGGSTLAFSARADQRRASRVEAIFRKDARGNSRAGVA
jgi:hypothetical protein